MNKIRQPIKKIKNNRKRKGDEFERVTSDRLGHHAIPIICHPQFLRSLNGGQLDLVFFNQIEGVLDIFELKSSKTSFLTNKQRKKIIRSAKILEYLFKIPARLYLKTPHWTHRISIR